GPVRPAVRRRGLEPHVLPRAELDERRDVHRPAEVVDDDVRGPVRQLTHETRPLITGGVDLEVDSPFAHLVSDRAPLRRTEVGQLSTDEVEPHADDTSVDPPAPPRLQLRAICRGEDRKSTRRTPVT